MDEKSKCPGYLQKRYGRCGTGDDFDYNSKMAKLALSFFHLGSIIQHVAIIIICTLV